MSIPSARHALAADQIADPASWRLGRYQLLSHLATGGMSEIYLARAVSSPGEGQLVALKVLPAHLASQAEFVTMFLDEARLAARIQHPNVLATLDIQAESPDACFLAMPYVEGDHLGTLLRSEAKEHRRLPVGVTLRVVMDGLKGLAAAHRLTDEQGAPLRLVHRDVSPHNLMVGTDGVTRLMDFGVAKARGRSTATQGGQLKGKLGYMAPEYATTGRADARADLFSMGVVLWEALTACRLFRGATDSDVLAKLLAQPIPPPSQRAPEAAPFDALLARALARDPADRFQSAEEFMTALEHVAVSVGGLASPQAVAQLVEQVVGPKLYVERAIARAPEAGPQGDRRKSSPCHLAVGDVVDGRYRVEGTLGHGANGVVYSATHIALQKRVALKVLRVDAAKRDSMVDRFLQEARSTSTMEHPHVVDITDFGHLPDERPYFVMEQLVGCTLRERLRQGPLSAREALSIAQQVASGLGAAHARQVIHRDLKPENIFLVACGRGEVLAKVLDFGVAKITNAPHLTQTGIVYGTPQYMSPEQGSGEVVDTRSDVYALGVILYEMLTGEAPFTGDTFMAVVYQHRMAPLPAHPRITAAHRRLFGVLQRALAKSPGDRHADMAALMADLSRCDEGAGAKARRRRLLAGGDASTRQPWRVTVYAALLTAASLGALALGLTLDAGGAESRGRQLVDQLQAGVTAPTTFAKRLPDAPPSSAGPAATAPRAAASDAVAAPRATRAPVRLRSTPEGAMVQQDGAWIGSTPLEVWLPPDQHEAQLTLTRGDHAPAHVRITPTSPAEIHVQLERPPAPPARAAGERSPSDHAAARAVSVSGVDRTSSGDAPPLGTRPLGPVDVMDPWE